jgi:hypothetical protein
MDLCTLIESLVIYDSLAFPIIYSEYASPLLDPLVKSGLIDTWYPEAGIINSKLLGDKEKAWEAGSVLKDKSLTYAHSAINILAGPWPDANYDKLSEISKKAIDGIAGAFANAVLSKDDNEISVLLWGAFIRGDPRTSFEATAAEWLTKGVAMIGSVPFQERTSPLQGALRVYNRYAASLRALANDNHVTIVKSAMEEPYFDSLSVETAAKDTLNLLLREAFDKTVTATVGQYIKVLPTSPFSSIALSRASNINEVLSIAVELRDEFKAYRNTLETHRQALAEIEAKQTLESVNEAKRIEASFERALASSLNRIDFEYSAKTNFFEPLHGIEKIIKSTLTGEYSSVLERLSSQLVDLLKGWYFMNYGGVYNVVSHFPKVQQLNGAAIRLIKKELDRPTISIVADAAERIVRYHNISGAGL